MPEGCIAGRTYTRFLEKWDFEVAMNIYIDHTTVEELEREIGAYTGAGNYTKDMILTLTEHGANFKLLVKEGFVPQKKYERELMSDESVLVRTKDITELGYAKGDLLLLPAVTGRILAKAYRIRKKNKDLKIYAVLHDRQHNIRRFDPMDRFFEEGIYRFAPVLYARYVIKKMAYNCLYPKWIGAIDKVFTVSNDTLQALSHKNLKWITYFYQSSSIGDGVPEIIPGADVLGDYILFVSGARPEKNLGRGLLAFREFCDSTDTALRLCVTGIGREKLYEIAGRLRLPHSFMDERVVSYDYVKTGQLAYLYQNCRYLLFLSKGEGFGLPVLEAVLFGKTVLCSRESAVPEVAGSILYYVDAFDVSSIRDGMLYLKDERNLLYRTGLAEKKKKIIEEQIELDKEILVREIVGE